MAVPPIPPLPERPEPDEPPRTRPASWTGLTLIVIVLVVALVAWLVSRDDAEPDTADGAPTSSATTTEETTQAEDPDLDPTEPAEPEQTEPDPIPTAAGPDPDAGPDFDEAAARIRALTEAPSGDFPACGSLIDLPAEPGPLALTGVRDLTLTPGERRTDTIDLVTTAGHNVIGGAAGSGAVLLFLHDDVVIGGQWTDPEDLDPVDLGPETTQELDLLVSAVVCNTGEGGTGPELDLPPGSYTAIAVIEALPEQVSGPDGRVEQPGDLLRPVSEPVVVDVVA